MIQGSDEVLKPTLYRSDKRNSLHVACLYFGRGLRKFLAVSSTTMESLQLKVLDFGLQMPTGPSLGVVACIYFLSLKIGLTRNEFG